jgi:hypothetical protein
MSSGGANADRSTVSASSLGGSTADEYTAIKNTNAHVSGNIEEVAPHDDDEETTTTTTTTKHSGKKGNKHSGRSRADNDMSTTASESWDAAKIKGADAYNAAKEKVKEYTGSSESNKDQSAKSSANDTAQSAKSAVKGAAAKVQDAASSASKQASEAADVASKTASDTASQVQQTAGEMYRRAHDTVKAQTGSDKPLRQQASEAASNASTRASDAVSGASETASQYGAAARDKAGQLYNAAHDTIQQQTGSDQPLRQQATTKAGEWASTLEAAAVQAKEKIVEYAGIAQAKTAEALKSASSSSAVSSVSSMLGMGGDPDKTVTTSTYESRETILEKDEAAGTAKVAKHETWTEQTNNGPKKENSKDSQYTTSLGKDGKL